MCILLSNLQITCVCTVIGLCMGAWILVNSPQWLFLSPHWTAFVDIVANHKQNWSIHHKKTKYRNCTVFQTWFLLWISYRNKDQTVPPGELQASSSKSSNSSNDAKSGGVHPSGSTGGGAPAGLGPSSSSSSSEPSPFDPFAAAANEDSRRLQGRPILSSLCICVCVRECTILWYKQN